MKYLKLLFLITGIILSNSLFAQNTLTNKQKERAENKVQIYTSEERDNLQMWFHDRVATMGITEKQEEQYFSVVLYYIVKMARLDDKDMELSEDEILTGLDTYTNKIHEEVKPILNEKQYEIHLESFDTLIKSVKNRLKSYTE